jgi:hypothetical protein
MPSLVPLQNSPIQNLSGYLVIFIIFLVILYIARWVYRDATARGSDWAWQWAFVTAIAFFAGIVPGVVVFVIYYYLR